MFTFRNDVRTDTAISRYLDGEMLPHERSWTEQRIGADPVMERRLRQIEALSDVLSSPPPADVIKTAEDRVRTRLGWELSRRQEEIGGGTVFRWWYRSISLPIPLVAAAGALFLSMILGLVFVSGFASTPVPNRTVADLADSRSPVNVQVQVGSAESDLLLRWLEEQNAVGKVSIELPSDAHFRFRGEPVLIRPRAGFDDLTTVTEDFDEDFEFIPLETTSE
jgi:anti-sigma factor RsiW